MKEFTTNPPTEEGYYIYINKTFPKVEIQHLILKKESDGWSEKSKKVRLYNLNADQYWDWGGDPGWLWDKDGLWKKIDMPSDPERLIKEFYGQQEEIH